eukprot:CAMPEP_0168522084 /NCGR_PEP_ID=MMETSP0405-20121227/9084_1 /TAXON_ID=498012 /ORGANISM="Trichosphaerium sp, Strain Am-I-7 wt" /LENGTH=324 /DNA_ID=CAMNT_0008543513 /DNA_START=1226 /DNA_END=2200 /DNA_ORIENTATION=-
MDIGFFNDWLLGLMRSLIDQHILLPQKLELNIPSLLSGKNIPQYASNESLVANHHNKSHRKYDAKQVEQYYQRIAQRFYHPDIPDADVQELAFKALQSKNQFYSQHSKSSKGRRRRDVLLSLGKRKASKKTKRQSISSDRPQDADVSELEKRNLHKDYKKFKVKLAKNIETSAELSSSESVKSSHISQAEAEMTCVSSPVGTLKIHVIEAKGLHRETIILNRSSVGLRPYCIVNYSTTYKKTSRSHTGSPEWNEVMEFALCATKERKIYLQVFSQSKLHADRSLGNEVVDFSELQNGITADIWVQLKGKTNGSVHLALTLYEDL